jgi:glycerol dehydrogenase
VVYENGVRQRNIIGKGADLVLVDSSIISRAPARLLVAGMGDALAKWYEGKPIFDRAKDPDSAIQSAMNLSTQIKETIFAFGLEAKRDADAKRNSKAVEVIIEANILLTAVVSGLGGAGFRAAVAHALLYGLSIHKGTHRFLHGEVVAFGILVQLCLEKKEGELDTALSFFSRLGLPMTLREIGIEDPEDPVLWESLERTCAEGSTVHNMPFQVSAPMLYQALLETEARVKAFGQRSSSFSGESHEDRMSVGREGEGRK